MTFAGGAVVRSENSGSMAKNIFESSDAVRTAQPLRHVQVVTLNGALLLESGGILPGVTVAFETYGKYLLLQSQARPF